MWSNLMVGRPLASTTSRLRSIKFALTRLASSLLAARQEPLYEAMRLSFDESENTAYKLCRGEPAPLNKHFFHKPHRGILRESPVGQVLLD